MQRSYLKTLIISGVLCFLVFIFVGIPSCSTKAESGTTSVDGQRKKEDWELLSTYLSSPFKPSLEMRENVDFVLTPALLIQHCESNDIVITYPEE